MTTDLQLDGYDAPEEVSGKKVDSRDRQEWVKARNKDRKKAGNQISALTTNRYFDGIPVTEINTILEAHGFSKLEPGIYCGAEGRLNEGVGRGVFLTLTWYKMESGRYEIVAYLAL